MKTHLYLSYVIKFSFSVFKLTLPTMLDAWDKRLDLVQWENLEGAGGEGRGRGDRDGEHM